jgi:hypothetical protein
MLPTVITAPFPSIEETAQRAGVSPSRAREIVRLAEGISDGSVSLHGKRSVVGRAAKRNSGMKKRATKKRLS